MTKRVSKEIPPSTMPAEPVPVPEDAALRFACARTKSKLTGAACVQSWARWHPEAHPRSRLIVSSIAKRLAACGDCEAGAARAMALGTVAEGLIQLTQPRVRIVEMPLDVSGIAPPPPMTPERLAALDPAAQPVPRRSGKSNRFQ